MPNNRLYSSPALSPNFNSSVEESNKKIRKAKISEQIKKTLSSSKDGDMSKEKLQEKKSIKKKSKESYNVVVSESDSDSDSKYVSQFFPKKETKLPYTRNEDELIVNYVLKGENIYKTSSILLWKFLERKKTDPKRTYQSLKNRFLRNIKPYLFTTFRHLIKDKNTVDRILTKFPELKKTLKEIQPLSGISLPKREGQPAGVSPEKKRSEVTEKIQWEGRAELTVLPRESDGVSSTIDLEEAERAEPAAPGSKPLESGPEILHARAHSRTVASKNGSIVVTVDLEKYCSEKRPSSGPLGIYQRFLKHKSNNVVKTCSKCGRGGFEGYSSDSNTDCEGRLVIASPPQTPPRESALLRDVENCSPAKRRRNENRLSPTKSPSLLKDTQTGEDSMAPDDRSQGSNSSRKKKEVSQDFLTDKDLETLYWNTVAFCRTFTDLDSDEEEAQPIEENPTSTAFPRLLHDTNLESFFLEKKTGKPVPGTSAPEASAKSENVLLKNMTKMLKAVEEQR